MEEGRSEESLKDEIKEIGEREKELETKVKELEEKLKKLEHVARVSNSRMVELQRELEYMKERYRKDLDEQRKYGYEKFAIDILNVIDNFERAIESGKFSKDFEAFFKGVELIYKDLLSILEKYNIREIDVEGKEFDPFTSEAVERVYSDEYPPNTVIRVVRKGYRLHEKVIRPARVVVSSEKEEIT